MVMDFRSPDVMVLSRMMVQGAFQGVLFVAVVFHVSESFTGDCKYCLYVLHSNTL